MTEKKAIQKQLIDRLEATRNLSRDEWIRLIQNRTADDADYLFRTGTGRPHTPLWTQRIHPRTDRIYKLL